MRVAVDTNVLIRAVVGDDSVQASVAAKILTDAELIAVASPCLCEFVWVLLRVYRFQPSDAADAIRALLASANVEVNRPAVEAGLAVLEAGGDFNETLQIQGTAQADTIDLSNFTTTSGAIVTVTGLDEPDTINLSNTAEEHIVYLSSTDGGATGDVINSFSVIQDLLLFKSTDFGGAGINLAVAGSKSIAVNGSAASKANLAGLGENFSGVIRISDNAAADWNDVAAVADNAIEGINHGINVVLLIDNGADTRVYFWNDGAETADSTVTPNELTLIGTLVSVSDATTVNAVSF